MATVGAYLRIDGEDESSLRDRLLQIDGVELFELQEPGTLGVIIEADDVDQAHATLTGRVQSVEGVMGAWPVYVNIEDE